MKTIVRWFTLPVFAALAVALAGCGGSSVKVGSSGSGTVSQGPGGSTSGDTPLSPATVRAVLDAADTQFSGIIAATANHDTRNQQMAAWLKTRPEFAASGVTSVDSVWGRLKNGHLFIASSAFIPGEDGRAAEGRGVFSPSNSKVPTANFPFRYANGSRAASSIRPSTLTHDRSAAQSTRNAANELPKNPQARVLLSLDKGFYNPPNDQIASMLRDHKYTVLQQMATVANLKSVSGDGAFYWGAHGSIGYDDRAKEAYWSVWTADDVTDAANDANKADLDDGSLVYFSAAYQRVGTKTVHKTHYAITTKFISKYNWSFAPDCFLFMNCCYSDYANITADMSGRSGPVTGIYGWSDSVGVDAAWKAGAYAFDRLLGANQTEPKETTPQRPFDSGQVYYEMKGLGLDNGAVSGNSCRLVSKDAGPPILSPSIERMEMSERLQESPLKGKSKLTLYGQFGGDKGVVKIGGVEVPIDTWKADKIECEPADLPGPGFAGDVLVISHDRPGNSVPLTQWHGKLTYTIDLLPPQASNAVSTITCDVYFRGDIHKYRDIAGQGRLLPEPFNFRAAQGSTARWVVTGNPPPMATWSGSLSADLPFGLNGTVNPPYGTGYIVSGVIDASSGAVKFSFNFLGCVTGYSVPGGGSPVATLHDPMLTSQGSNIGSDGYVVYSNNLPAAIGRDDYVIPGATLTGSTPIFEPKLVWTDFIPTFQPDDKKGEDNGH